MSYKFPNGRTVEALALLLTGFCFLVLCCFSGAFFLGAGSLVRVVLPVALGLPPAVYALQNRRQPAAVLRPLLGYFLVLGGSFLLAALFWENTYDGQTYHWQAFTSLIEGWNPWRTLLPDAVPNAIFINHYPKGQELFAAATGSILPSRELGKAAGPVLAVAAFCYSYALLRRYRSRRQSLLLALLLVANPVIASQLLTYMPDGLLGCCLLLLAGGLFNWYSGRKSGMWMSLFAATLLISLKFTGLVYAGVFFALAGLFWLRRARGFSRQVFGFAAISGAFLAFATFFVSYNPYATNLAGGRHLFYPLMGEGAVDIMVGTNAPPSFKEKNRLVKLGTSLLARSSNVHGAPIAPEPILKIPFTIRLKEWTVFKGASVLYGGFGPLFSGILLLSGLLFVAIWRHDRHSGRQLLVFWALVLAAVLINPESWLARYVPHLWLLPLSVLFWSLKALPAGTGAKRLQGLLTGIILVNAGLIWGVNTASNAIISYQMRSEYRWLQTQVRQPVALAERDFISAASRLRAYGIPYTPLPGCVKRSTCPLPDSAGFRPIASGALLLLPKDIPPYQPGAWFEKLSSFVSHAPSATPSGAGSQ